MRRFLFLILLFLNISVFAQWDFGSWHWNNSVIANSDRNLSVLTNPEGVDSTQPSTSFNDGYLYLNGTGSNAHTGHNPFYVFRYATTDTLRVEMEIGLTTVPKLGTYIISYFDPNAGGWSMRVRNDASRSVEFVTTGMDSAITIGAFADGDTTTHKFVVRWQKSDQIMHAFMDGVNTRNRSNVTFGNPYPATVYGLCLGNQVEVVNASSYVETYTAGQNTGLFRGIFKSLIIAKNDTAFEYSFNQGNTQNFFPVRKIHGIIQRPIYPLEYVDRHSPDSTSPGSFIFQNGGSHGIDTMDCIQYRKDGFKDSYVANYESMSSLQFYSDAGITGEGFNGQLTVHNGVLYSFGNVNVSNGFTAFRIAYDSAKGTNRWEPITGKWNQMGYGLITPTGTSGTMFGFFFNNDAIALGYDNVAVGVGTVNYAAILKEGQSNWSAMGSGLDNVGFSGNSAYGNAYIGGFFSTAGGKNARRFAKWNGSIWDSCGVGPDNTVLAVFPDSSDGVHRLLIGGYHDSAKSKGVTIYSKGLVCWNEDSDIYESFHNLRTTANAVYDITYNDGYYYFVGDFPGITDGVDTTTSYGLARYKVGVGLQNIGTGVFSVMTYRGITSVVILNNIMYVGGSFSRFNNMLFNNFAAVNLLTGKVINVGRGTDMRIEALTSFEGNILGAGDNFHVNGLPFWCIFKYIPNYEDTSHVIITHTSLTDTAEFNFPLTVTCTASKLNGTSVDTVWLEWKKGTNGTIHDTTLIRTTGITYTGKIAPDTSTINAGTDTLFYVIKAVDLDTSLTITPQYAIRVLSNPLDYRNNLYAHWSGDTNIVADALNATWQSTIDTLTGRQNTTGDKPIHVSNQINGHGVMRFVTNDYFNLPTITLTNFTVVAAIKSRQNTDNYVISNASDGIWVSLTAAGYGIGSFDGTRVRATSTAGADTNWHIITWTNSKIYVDGIEKTYTSAQTLTGIIFDVLGGRPGVGFNFKGDIADLRTYTEQVSATNLLKVWAAINRDYHIH